MPISSRFSYELTEESLSRTLGFELHHPLRIITLDGLGIDAERFIEELAPTFLLTTWDLYDLKRQRVNFLKRVYPETEKQLNEFLANYFADRQDLSAVYDLLAGLSTDDRRAWKRISPSRKRAVARFRLTRVADSHWVIIEQPAQPFVQQAVQNDPRAVPRKFPPMPPQMKNHPLFRQFMRAIADIVRELRPEVVTLEITAHQMETYANVMLDGDNSPEGIHQDDSDYIVSALVLKREGIVGGESRVYLDENGEKKEILRHVLQPGAGIFQADRNTPLWHVVTKIAESKGDPAPDGQRTIIGLDINIVA